MAIIQNPKIKARCNTCAGVTNHEVLALEATKHRLEIEEDLFVDAGVNWRLIKCGGCDSISLQRESWNDYDEADDNGYALTQATYYPPRIFRKMPDWIEKDRVSIPPTIKQFIRELYVALQNDCNAAATMLTRAIFEHAMIESCGDHGSFTENLKKFGEEGHIGKRQVIVVESMLEAGHGSMHRAYIPDKDDIVTVVDILESVLSVIYDQAPRADALKTRIPPKQKKAPASQTPPTSQKPPLPAHLVKPKPNSP